MALITSSILPRQICSLPDAWCYLMPTIEAMHVFHAGRMHPSRCLLLDLTWTIAEQHSAGWIFWKWTLQESFLNQKWTEANCFAYGVIQCSDMVIETNLQRWHVFCQCLLMSVWCLALSLWFQVCNYHFGFRCVIITLVSGVYRYVC